MGWLGQFLTKMRASSCNWESICQQLCANDGWKLSLTFDQNERTLVRVGQQWDYPGADRIKGALHILSLRYRRWRCWRFQRKGRVIVMDPLAMGWLGQFLTKMRASSCSWESICQQLCANDGWKLSLTFDQNERTLVRVGQQWDNSGTTQEPTESKGRCTYFHFVTVVDVVDDSKGKDV